jgi:OPT family oligopeptide transporter
LMAAGITGAGASQAGDMMQDLKTGHLLGAEPRHQFKAQLIGIAAGILFCVPIYKLFDNAYDIGGEQLPAPAAHAWKAMAELLSNGFDSLPPMAGWAVTFGCLFGIVMVLLGKVERFKNYMPSGLAFGIAFIVPAYYSVSMFLGAMVFYLWQKRYPAKAESLGFSIASGLIAGEGLMGIIVAILTLMGFGAIS